MRITHSTVTRSVGYYLQQNLSRLEKYSSRMATGKKFQRPSEDPAGVNKSMYFRTSINRNDRFLLNMNESRGWLGVTEIALSQSVGTLQRVRELAVYGANDTLSTDERQAIASEVYGHYEHLLALCNTEFNGLYIFGGHRTGEKPFREDYSGQIRYYGDDGERRQEISPHQEVAMNLSGARAFGAVETLDAVREVFRALVDNDRDFLGGEALKKMDDSISRLMQSISEVGARMQRLDAADSALFDQTIYLREMLSRVEDIDLAYTMIEYQMQENAYQAALATASRMLQPSLIDYLR
ncbi:MAG: flagellar hook-associated protein FlgL [Bacillota bacterium]